MKNILMFALLAGAIGTPAMARDTELHLPFADVLAMPEAQSKLDGSIKFYLSGQKTPKVLEKKGEESVSKKTNGANKDDVTACKWAALSVLLTMQEQARRVGANAVVNIVSNYKHQPSKSPKDYECHAGAIIVGVALKGTYAKVAAK
ncbi:excinuclease ATPase subunit [Methylibium rhizosphaerae]|jgi:uncharacterized protein YbjQ (UPF0145 family)|uniref:excinuclease ATPase subunit n=1 Tax=Methylibium rhizosphaerae TaxID=2570323 RepID=UPI0015E442B3|nr:excinuclease ATPase subunit [Methylibium rhizosphaerae]